MKQCPSCEREFYGIEDYPKIIIKSLERSPLPEDNLFTYEIGVGEEMVPEEVKHHFETQKEGIFQRLKNFPRKKTENKTFEWDGSVWSPRNHPSSRGNRYLKQQDQREEIIKFIEPYMTHIESLVETEIKPHELYQPFTDSVLSGKIYGFGGKIDHQTAFSIPNTEYYLQIISNKSKAEFYISKPSECFFSWRV